MNSKVLNMLRWLRSQNMMFCNVTKEKNLKYSNDVDYVIIDKNNNIIKHGKNTVSF